MSEQMNEMSAACNHKSPIAEEDLPVELLWIKDAPLFIDETTLGRLYDAVVRPVYKEDAPVIIRVTDAQAQKLQGKIGVNAKAGLAPWLATLLSFGAEASVEGGGESAQSASKETTITLHPISTPQRQLEQLAIWYLFNQRSRLLTGDRTAPLSWQNDRLWEISPRALVFVDLPSETKIIPMAAEFADGSVTTFYDKLRASSGEFPPKYEETERKTYWKWFGDNFDRKVSIELIEAASTSVKAPIRWIDFRCILNDEGDTLHLHLEGAERYSVGTFAYQLVNRTLGHGLRVVGTLKGGPDVNVLALYEK